MDVRVNDQQYNIKNFEMFVGHDSAVMQTEIDRQANEQINSSTAPCLE